MWHFMPRISRLSLLFCIDNSTIADNDIRFLEAL